MSKVLIFNYRKLANTGGPEGYLYNIYTHLQSNPTDQIVFYSDLLNQSVEVTHPKHQKENLYKTFVNDVKQVINLCWRIYNRKGPTPSDGFDINDYDFVHIHKINDFFTFKNRFPQYKGKVILTSHCPCPWTDEMLSHYDRFVAFFRPIILYWECKAFKNADYIMFPCKGAREPYEKERRINKVFVNNEDKFFYVPSAITDVNINEESMQKFAEIGIPEDSFVISYFGRHNSIKGYDIIKKVGSELLDKYPNLYFVCAGRGEIEPLNHPRWIELGFIGNAQELLYQSDLYISANRETYFDLIVLEILRSGTKLILSETGGNNFFKDYPVSEKNGLEFFDISDFNTLLNLVENNIVKKNNMHNAYAAECAANRTLFLAHFTMDKYVSNYISSIKKLVTG